MRLSPLKYRISIFFDQNPVDPLCKSVYFLSKNTKTRQIRMIFHEIHPFQAGFLLFYSIIFQFYTGNPLFFRDFRYFCILIGFRHHYSFSDTIPLIHGTDVEPEEEPGPSRPQQE